MTFAQNDYNQRQFRQMLYTLDDYERGDTSLGRTISRLEGLLGCLEEPNDAWIAQFRCLWAVLEHIHAGSLNIAPRAHARPNLSITEQNKVNGAVSELKKLIREVAFGKSEDEENTQKT